MKKLKLEKLIKKSDVNGLIAALSYEGGDDMFEIWTGAAEALGNLGRPEALEPLREKLDKATDSITSGTTLMRKMADQNLPTSLESMRAGIEASRQRGVVYGRALLRLGDSDSAPIERFLAAVSAFDPNKADQSRNEIQQQ